MWYHNSAKEGVDFLWSLFRKMWVGEYEKQSLLNLLHMRNLEMNHSIWALKEKTSTSPIGGSCSYFLFCLISVQKENHTKTWKCRKYYWMVFNNACMKLALEHNSGGLCGCGPRIQEVNTSLLWNCSSYCCMWWVQREWTLQRIGKSGFIPMGI